MKTILSVFSLFLILSIPSCIEIEDQTNNPRGNFETLWKIMDEGYCFFEYKRINWDSIHVEYSKRINDNMSDEALFSVLSSMLQELKDGHVNLYTPFDVGRYWKWFEDYPRNFNCQLIEEKYLGKDYLLSAGMKYKILNDNIGYIYYPDFSASLEEENLDRIIEKLAGCDGIILDVRENGGGKLSHSEELASRFANEKTLVGYILHKTGKEHNQFSEPRPKYITPSNRLRYQKQVVVLTNRKCYSATNDFVNSMRLFPTVTIMGDRTGGGGGFPLSSELPNGWSVRFSACPTLDANKQQIEFGIDPDIKVNLLNSDMSRGLDTLIETARNYLKQSKSASKLVK